MSAVVLAETFTQALARAGAGVVFGLPGGGNNLEVVGAAKAAGLRFVLTHTETAAAIMAAVHADVTDRPCAVVVTRGPGAASAVNGTAQALLDRQPVLVLTDTVPDGDRARIQHQLLDQQTLFAAVTKGQTRFGRVDPERTVEDALTLAYAHPRGPVQLDFDPAWDEASTLSTSAGPDPERATSSEDVETVRRMVAQSRHPVVLLGVGARDAGPQLRRLLAGSNVPVLMTYRAKGLIPDSWDNCAGLLTGATIEAETLHASDLILAVGLDTVELIPATWPYAAPVVSISGWATADTYLDRRHDIIGEVGALVDQLQDSLSGDWAPGSGQALRERGLDRLREDRVAAGAISPQQLVQRVRALAPAGTIATVDAGAHMLAVLPLWDTEGRDEVIVSSGLATMGFALPAAIAAALAFPDRRVVCFTGDGGLGMVLAELETLVRLQVAVTVVVFNDSLLSLIAVKQSEDRHGGSTAVAYEPIDFATVATGFGIPSRSVASPDELDGAIRSGLDATGPFLLDVRIDADCYPAVLDAIRGARASVQR